MKLEDIKKTVKILTNIGTVVIVSAMISHNIGSQKGLMKIPVVIASIMIEEYFSNKMADYSDEFVDDIVKCLKKLLEEGKLTNPTT